MLKRWREFLAKHQDESEESVTYRVAITVLVMFCLVLTLHQLEWPVFSPAVLVLTPAASVLSYYRRKNTNVWLKIFLSFAMVALLLWFLVRLSVSLYDPRIPLAELLIWLQTLHAFDLPARKDLRYTGLVALILMAIACVLTYSTYFSLALLMFCALFVGVLCIDFWAGNRTAGTVLHSNDRFDRPSSAPRGRLNPRWLLTNISRTLPLAALGAGLIFLFMPRYQGLTLRTLPVSWDIQFSLAKVSQGDIVNPSLGATTDNLGQPQQLSGDDYFGFGSTVNLNARGKLSDRQVMKVRTSNWQYHRGVSFAEYTGFGWKSYPWEPVKRQTANPPFHFPHTNWREERITIYYVNDDLPNLIFTPPSPSRLFFPSSELYVVDSFNPENLSPKVTNYPATLVSPSFLEEGLVYSTINQVPSTTISMLKERRSSPTAKESPPHLRPFLQLPPTVTQRTRKLASELCEGKTSAWAKAAALTAYLQQNYNYQLDVDFYPENADTVDHFLFEVREGYCEQFATSLCVMARSVGLPSRYVTGYLPGTFNPITGFYEIKSSDAHAWAEIYFEGYGWMLFDPVPGENPNPESVRGESQRWLFESLLEYLQVPPVIRNSVPTLIRLFVVLALLSLAVALFRKKRADVQGEKSDLLPFLTRAENLTEKRAGGETVRSWSQRLAEWPELGLLAELYEERYYKDRALDNDDRRRLEEALSSLKSRRAAQRPR